MTIESLIKLLEAFNPQAHLCEPNIEIYSIRRCGSPYYQGKYSELLVGRDKDFVKSGIPVKTKNILCFGKPLSKEIFPDLDSKNVITVAEKEAEGEIFNCIMDQLETSERYRYATELLMHSAMNLRRDAFDITRMMDVIYDLLGNPVSICNIKGEVIGQKHLFDVENKEMPLIFKGDYMIAPNEHFAKISEIVDSQEEPLVLENKLIPMGTNVVGKIVIGKKTVAYLSLMEFNKPVSEFDITMVKIICEYLGREFQKVSFDFEPKSSELTSFLVDLIENKQYEDISVDTRAKLMNFGQNDWHYIVLVNLQNVDINKTVPGQLRQIFESRLPDCQAQVAIYYDNLVLFIDTSRSNYFSDENCYETINMIAEEKGLTIGISDMYSNLSDTYLAYNQAKQAIVYGEKVAHKGCIFLYDSYRLFHLIDYIDDPELLLSFCHPKLVALLDYDRKHDTQYTYTAFVLLKCDGKQTEAAKQLNVHRSTLLYRIDKINAITNGLNLYDTYNHANLFLTFVILIKTGMISIEEYDLSSIIHV